MAQARKKLIRQPPLPASAGATTGDERWRVAAICLALTAIIFAVFGQTLRDDFINYDDNVFVYENPQVSKGLTLNGIAQAFFTHGSYDNWNPLTTISHMVDCQCYGLNASGHHLTNILLHAATAILLFLVLRQMTGALWRSAFVAAVFAIHPLRVESVAWISERKDVLSGLFFMLTIGAYVRYARRPWSPAGYGLVALLFALGLMCKPMLVTLPLVLLLLDYWPLKRFTQPGVRFVPWRLVVEKVPLLALSGAACLATLFAQTLALSSFEQISLPLRAGNALISYVTYLGQMFWPSGLAVLYPFAARDIGIAGVVLSLVVLAGISTGVFVLRRRHPYLLTGWLWYLGMLVPVIGLVQVGTQARADRYTYLPQIGLYLLLTWAAADLCAGWRHRGVVLGGCASSILVALIFCARAQTAYWQDSESLWTHTLACTTNNNIAHNNLGIALFEKGRVDEAVVQYQKALEIEPDYADADYNLGNAFFQQGRLDEAIAQWQKVLKIQPDDAQVHNDLGFALFEKGHVDEAVTHYEKALGIKPDYTEAHNNLGIALAQKGRLDEAIAQYQMALQIKPDDAEVHNNLGIAFAQKGRLDETITHYQKALQIKPDYLEVQNNLAWVLATAPQASLRNGNQAVKLAQQANRLAGGENPIILQTLAAAYAEAGRFSEAVATVQQALPLAGSPADTELASRLRKALSLYQAGIPFHNPE
jgi:protein O-mannosyl-transferase